MYEQFYERISAPWRNRTDGARLLALIDKGLRIAVAALYGFMLIYLMAEGSDKLLRALMVPFFTLCMATVLRIMLNEERPYEKHAIFPLLAKDTKGRSMPSRHVASATVIACTICWVNPLWGAVAFILAAAVAYVRVVGGVHFPRDVAVGAGLGILFVLLGFVFIP